MEGKYVGAVTINIIRQKERNKINLNQLNYLKRYLFAQRLWLKWWIFKKKNSYVVCVVAHIVLYKTTTCT